VAKLQAIRAELARVVERYPAAACHAPTATARRLWPAPAVAAHVRGRRARAVAARARSAHPRTPWRL